MLKVGRPSTSCNESVVIFNLVRPLRGGFSQRRESSANRCYGIESPIIATLKPKYYKRYIDDTYSIFSLASTATTFVSQFNSVCPSIKFEAVTIKRSGVMLDLEFSLHTNTTSINEKIVSYDNISHKIYQKERNIYQYIPFVSEHKSSIFTNFILQELKRYSLFCTDENDFLNIVKCFTDRLLARGYPPELMTSQLLKLPPRKDLLTALKKPSNPVNNILKKNPIN